MNFKRLSRLLTIFLSVVLLTSGCMKLEMDIVVSKNDTVSGTMVFAIAKSITEMAAEGADSSPADSTEEIFPKEAEITSEPFDDGEFVGTTYKFEDLPLDELAPATGGDSAFSIERNGDNLVVSGSLDTSSYEADFESSPMADSLKEEIAALTSIKISISLPGEVIQTNGEVDGETITWVGSFGEKIDLQAVSVSPLGGSINWLLLIGISVVIIGLAAGLAIRFFGKTRPKSGVGTKSNAAAAGLKTKKQTKAETLAAEANALRPWYQKKRFAFPAIGVLALSLLAIAIGLVLPPGDSSSTAESDKSSAEERIEAKQDASDESEKTTQGNGAAAPAAPAAPPAQPEPQVIIVKVQEEEPAGRTPPAVQAAPSETESQRFAREDAGYYWSEGWYSRSGLINYLVDLGYSYSDAEYGTDSLGVDWYSEASGMANWYLSGIYMSRLGLIGQLEWEGFTTDEAIYGTDSTEADWFLQAYGQAVELIAEGYTEQEAYEYLIFDEYTYEEANFGSYYAANPD